ncbi:MAG: DUF2948 family protein [Alphaproteobacteria bacterium]
MSGKQQAGGSAAPEHTPLKLRAHDAEDLGALATCLQDALVPLADVAYLKADKRFVMVANRFMWERGAQDVPAPGGQSAGEADADARFEESEAGPRYYRVNCAVYFDWVRNVRFHGLNPRDKDQILNLLTVEVEPGESGSGSVLLMFSGGGTIRLEVRDIRCHLEDLGEPWPTRWRPDHAESKPT